MSTQLNSSIWQHSLDHTFIQRAIDRATNRCIEIEAINIRNEVTTTPIIESFKKILHHQQYHQKTEIKAVFKKKRLTKSPVLSF